MFSICTNYITVGDDLFQVKRVFSEDRVPDIELFRYWLDAETVFRKEGKLYFCNKIQEAEIINE